MTDTVAISLDTPLWDKRRSMVVFAGMSKSPIPADVIQPFFSTPPQLDMPILRKLSLPKSFTGWMSEPGPPAIYPVQAWWQLPPIVQKTRVLQSFTGWMSEDRGNNLTGLSITSSVGTLAYSTSYGLTSDTVTVANGQLRVGISIPLIGSSIAVNLGNVFPSISGGSDVNATLVGQAISASLGTLVVTATGDKTVALSGLFHRVDLGNFNTYQQTPPIGGNRCVCQVCGRRVKCHELKKRWDGVLVCTEDWEPRQPQDFVRGMPDTQFVPEINPEPTDTFLNPGAVKPEDL